MSLVWQDPESRAKSKPEISLPLFEQAVACEAETTQLRKEVPMMDEPLVKADSRQAEKRPTKTGNYKTNFLIKKLAPSSAAGSSDGPADIAHARNSDGKHSHEAAKSVVNLGRTRDAILAILRYHGGMTDEQIAAKYEYRAQLARPQMPKVSPSGLRSRRSELCRMGFVVEAGEGVTASGRKCSIWRLA